jgi:hypothetical protein
VAQLYLWALRFSVDVLRRIQYRTPVGSLENAVLCCALFTKPYHSNDGAVLLRVCIAMGMLLHSNEHLQISTVADVIDVRNVWEDSMEGSHKCNAPAGIVSISCYPHVLNKEQPNVL